jgi:hypothetical protein
MGGGQVPARRALDCSEGVYMQAGGWRGGMWLCRHCTLAFTAGKRARADFDDLDFGDDDDADDDAGGGDAAAAHHDAGGGDAAAAHHDTAEKHDAENVYRELSTEWKRGFDELTAAEREGERLQARYDTVDAERSSVFNQMKNLSRVERILNYEKLNEGFKELSRERDELDKRLYDMAKLKTRLEKKEQRLEDNVTEKERELKHTYGEDFISALKSGLIDEKHPS